LAAHKAFVPIDPQFPVQRLKYIITQAAIRLVVVDSTIPCTTIDILKNVGVALLQYDLKSGEAKLVYRPISLELKNAPPISGVQIAYILFTSGTTGNPKGVMIRNESQVEFVKRMASEFRHDLETRWLSVAPLYFDVSTLDMFVEVYSAATVILMPPNLMAHVLAEALEKFRITHVLLISSQIKMLASKFSGVEHRDLSRLQEIWYGGEACPVESLRQIHKMFPHISFVQGYGPTEVCNNSTIYRFNSIPDGLEGYMPLGRTLDSVEGYVIDENGNLLIGEGVGELLLGGVQVMEGYINDSELTATVLIYNRFNRSSQYKLYRTGDYVRVDAEGLLHFHGRKDDLVKVRGNRVSLHEVQAAIISLPSVLDAVVFVGENEVAGILDSLNAVVLMNSPMSANEIKMVLNERLPKYMVPDRIRVFKGNDIPIKENGKLDRGKVIALHYAPTEIQNE
jgi:amino acid adenylation domain-containing protein